MMEVVSGIRADIVVHDSEGRVVLLVEVKGRPAGKEVALHIRWLLQTVREIIPFAMLIDPDSIHVYQWDGADLSEPICSLRTADVLQHYDPEFGSRPVFEHYLETLSEAWLRDLAYHWKSELPPASEQLAAIGLLQRLEGGTTHAEVALGGDTLH